MAITIRELLSLSPKDFFRHKDVRRYIPKTQVDAGDITKADLGLGNVDNTSDASKPISTATQTALDGKQDKDSPNTITYAASVALDFSLSNVQTISLTGNITFAPTLNKAAGKGKVVRLICDSTSRTFTFPSEWIWLGDVAPSSIAAGKTGVLSLYCFGTNATDVVASYSVQQ
jgi:hypothetical protein